MRNDPHSTRLITVFNSPSTGVKNCGTEIKKIRTSSMQKKPNKTAALRPRKNPAKRTGR
jgi:hypothetical protein